MGICFRWSELLPGPAIYSLAQVDNGIYVSLHVLPSLPGARGGCS